MVVKQKFCVVFFAYLVLKCLDLLAVVFDHLAAAHAEDVVVVAFGTGALEEFAFALPDRQLDDPAFQKKREGAKNSPAGDIVVLFPQDLVEFLPIKVLREGTDLLIDPLSLPGEFETFFFEKSLKRSGEHGLKLLLRQYPI